MVSIAILLSAVTVFGCNGESEIGEGVPFSIQVNPISIEGYPADEFTFLVKVTSEETRKVVNISASVVGASLAINPESIMPGDVAEVIVVPFNESTGKLLIINIEGERDGIIEKTTANIYVGTES